MTAVPYLWSDAWLLLSVIVAGSPGGATLESIISTGDGINHAIFTFHEVDGGLARLLAGGLIRIDDERVFPTEEAQELYNLVQDEGMLSRMKSLGRAIGAPEWSPSHDPKHADPAWSLTRFSTDDLNDVYKRYKRRFAAALRDLEKRGR